MTLAEEHDPIFYKKIPLIFAITNSFDVLPVHILNRKEGLERYYSYCRNLMFFKVSKTRKKLFCQPEKFGFINQRAKYAQAGIVPHRCFEHKPESPAR